MDESIYKQLKKGGFMKQIQEDKFSLRLRVVAGQMKSAQLQKVSEIADRYGHGYIHMTARQGIEIPFIDFGDIDAVKDELATVGLQPGACGPRVRTVTACQGNAVCGSGLIETSGLAGELDALYFAKDLPHKFKIGITGCPNNCLKAEENDVGIKGGILPSWDAQRCTYCGVCAAVCPSKAVAVDQGAQNALRLDREKCIYCGKCVKSCPTDSWSGRHGYQLSFGGTFGSRQAFGVPLLPLILEKEILLRVVDAAVSFFREFGRPGERFRQTIEREGADRLKQKLEEAAR